MDAHSYPGLDLRVNSRVCTYNVTHVDAEGGPVYNMCVLEGGVGGVERWGIPVLNMPKQCLLNSC